MRLFRLLLCGGATLIVGLALLDAADAPAQNRVQRKKPDARALQTRGGGGELVSAKVLEKLSLTKEQKEKFDKINQDFQAQQKDLQAKVQDAAKNRDRNKLKTATEAQQKLRTDSLTTLRDLLNDTQKKALEEAPREDPPARPRVGVAPSRRGGVVPGQLLPPQLQEKLNLTNEQKKKLTDLQKEVDSKIQNFLTEEQRKILEETKKTTQPRKRVQE